MNGKQNRTLETIQRQREVQIYMTLGDSKELHVADQGQQSRNASGFVLRGYG